MQDLLISAQEKIDNLQVALADFESVDCPLKHVYLQGVYIRQIKMPAITINSQGEEVQTVVVSKVHKTMHPYCITQGKVAVYNSADEFCGLIEAPYAGMTPAGTRRVLVIVEDCLWLTIHRLPYITGDENNWSESQKEVLLMKIEKDLIEEREVSL